MKWSSLLECTSAPRFLHLYDWWALLRSSSKSFKGARTSRTCQNMHFSYSARGEYRGLHAVPHQWERSLGMQLHVWSNIWLSFNQLAVPLRLHLARTGSRSVSLVRGSPVTRDPVRVWQVSQNEELVLTRPPLLWFVRLCSSEPHVGDLSPCHKLNPACFMCITEVWSRVNILFRFYWNVWDLGFSAAFGCFCHNHQLVSWFLLKLSSSQHLHSCV